MRLSIITIFLLFTQSSFIYASDINIDAQIEKIRQAPQSQRFQLVNELKQQIAQMNANEQARSIAKFQEETLNAQQTEPINEPNIANQANQEVIKNQLQQEQEHQIIIPPVENIEDSVNNTIDKVLPNQNPIKTIPKDNIQDNQPNYNDQKNDDVKQSNPIQNPVEEITDNIQPPIQNPVEDIKDNVKEQIQNPAEDITDNIQQPIQNPAEDIQKEIQQPEVIKDIPKQTDPNNNQQQPKPTIQKPSIPTNPSKRRF